MADIQPNVSPNIQEENTDNAPASSSQAASFSIQEKVEEFFHTIFGKWGQILSQHTCKVFWFSILFFIVLSGGNAKRAEYEDQQTIWTPANNPSILAREKSDKLFPSKSGFVSIIAEVKNPGEEGSSIITVEALNEIKGYVDKMVEASAEING